MSDNLYDILNRLNQLNEGLNPQQRSVPQLPADAKPKHISVLGSKTDPEHPFAGYMVGADESAENSEQPLSELSPEKLGQYKKAAGAAATAADKAGDYEKGHKRFKGIVKATNKEFDKSTKSGVAEAFEDDGKMSWDDWRSKAKSQGAVKFQDTDNKTIAYDKNGKRVSSITWSKKKGVAEGVTSPEIKQAYDAIMKTTPKTPERKRAIAHYQKLRADAIAKKKQQDIAEGSETAADIDKKIEFHKKGQAAAQYKGSMNKMHAAKIRELEAKKKQQGVAEGFPHDVDHMPGPVIRNADMTTDNVKTRDKAEWDRAVDSINAKVFDDMAEFRTDRNGESVTGNSAVWAKWDAATQTGWFNAKGRPLKPWPVKESGVAEGESQLYKHHQELRKKSGLPDPEVYKKIMKQKQAEIDALNAEISADKKDVKEADLSVPDVTGPAPQEGDWVKGKIGIGPYAGKLGQIERIDPKRNVMRMGPEALVWMKTAAREEWLPLKWLVKVGGSKFAESKINEEVANEDVLSALKTKLGDLLLQTLGKEIKDTDLKSKKDNKDDKEVNPIIKKITTDDGHEICIHGNEDDGFRVSVKQKEAPTVYKTLDEAVMACEMYCAHRKNKKLNADYVDES